MDINPVSYDAYRGQWGGKIENGEEMWWSTPNARLRDSSWARFFFKVDVRQHFLLRFWKHAVERLGRMPEAVLDFGCGSGGTTLNFSMMTGVPIQGLDIFKTQLEIANRSNAELGLRCEFALLGEGGRIPRADASVDVIFSFDVLGHVPNIPAVLAEWARVLKPGGSVVLFTEATYSEDDRSWMRQIARDGIDMMAQVPEHISLFPKEKLEMMFEQAGLRALERYSANVAHFFFFPKDYVLLLRGKSLHRGIYRLARVWDRISKITPFYPWPFQFMRLALTHLFGRRANGTSYFYHLVKS